MLWYLGIKGKDGTMATLCRISTNFNQANQLESISELAQVLSCQGENAPTVYEIEESKALEAFVLGLIDNNQ